jgi:membrane protease YdiL (CAAX protease family)
LIVGLFGGSGEYVLSKFFGFGKISQISKSQDSLTLMLSYFFYFLGSITFSLLICKFEFNNTLSAIGLSIKNKADDFLKGSLLGFMLIGIGFLIFLCFDLVSIAEANFSILDLSYLAIMFIMVSISEELVSRGVFITMLKKGFNGETSLIISAVVFGGLHLLNANVTFLSFANICLAGLMLGIAYYLTKNLMFPIGLHFTWNYFQGPIFGFEVSGNKTYTLITQKLFGDKIWTGGDFGFEGSIIAIPIMILATYFIYKHFKNLQSISSQE